MQVDRLNGLNVASRPDRLALARRDPSATGRPMIAPETLEETDTFRPRFGESGLLPVITIDAERGEVLMLAYMNEEALRLTLESGDVHYWSRSRNSLWRKGESSGHTQRVVSIRTDCDQDTLLIAVRQTGPACHTGRRSCFYRALSDHRAAETAGDRDTIHLTFTA